MAVSQSLLAAFQEANKSQCGVRFLKVEVINESLELAQQYPTNGESWESEFSAVSKVLEPKKPCYILYRHDDKNANGNHTWILLSYVPDNAKVREKMLYASTRATLAKDLGSSWFADSMYGTHVNDFTLESYKAHLISRNSDGPLTEKEEVMKQVREMEQIQSTRLSHAPGVAFPFSESALEGLRKLVDNEVNFAQFGITQDQVQLLQSKEVNGTELSSNIPLAQPSFTLYRDNQTGEESMVFLYACPRKSVVRDRMIYSTSRSNFLAVIEEAFGKPIKVKMEIDDPEEFTARAIYDELCPSPQVKTGFAKPKFPAKKKD